MFDTDNESSSDEDSSKSESDEESTDTDDDSTDEESSEVSSKSVDSDPRESLDKSSNESKNVASEDASSNSKNSSSAKSSKPKYVRRQIAHEAFKNLRGLEEAKAFLKDKPIGDRILRPSSNGKRFLTLTWKVTDNIYAHNEIEETTSEVDPIEDCRVCIGRNFNGI